MVKNKFIDIKKENIISLICSVLFVLCCIFASYIDDNCQKILILIGVLFIGLFLFKIRWLNDNIKSVFFSVLHIFGVFIVAFEYNISRATSADKYLRTNFFETTFYTESFGVLLGLFQVSTIILILLKVFSLLNNRYDKFCKISSVITCGIGFLCFLYQPIYLNSKWGVLSGDTNNYLWFAFICLFCFLIDITNKKTSRHKEIK